MKCGRISTGKEAIQMSVKWTEEQEKVIQLRNRSLLVSAAAGSGKTAVLVQRIISMVMDEVHPLDIDRLLVVTFTNAAAAEMRERVGTAIEAALEKDPYNQHLQRQLTLVHNAQITTIDSFCIRILRDHFHKIDLEPGFRIADEGELKLLREDVCEAVLEEFYEKADPEFLRFADSYSQAKGIMKVYEGWQLDCAVDSTIVRGRVVYENGKVDESASGWGEFVKPVLKK